MHGTEGRKLSDKIVRNTRYNFFWKLWEIVAALFLTPYILSHVGLERYGIWALVTLVTGYFGLLDLGIGAAYVKHISECYSNKDRNGLNEIINTGFSFYLIFSVVIILLAFLFIHPIMGILKIPSGLQAEASVVIICGIALFGFSGAASVFSAVQAGLQRMDISVKISMVSSMLNVIGVILMLSNGAGLIGLMLNNIIVFFIATVINVIVAYKLLPGLVFAPFVRVKKAVFMKLFSFGYRMQIVRLGELVLYQTDRLLIAIFFGVKFVGIYQVGAMLVNYAKQLPLFLLPAALPAAAEISTRKDTVKLVQLYLRGTKYLFVITAPIMALLVSLAHLVVKLWVGDGYGISATIVQILAAGYLVNVTVGMAFTVGMGIGLTKMLSRSAMITMLVNLILSVILIKLIGFYGVAIATSIALITGPVYIYFELHRYLDISVMDLLRNVIFKPFLASIVAGLSAYCAQLFFFAAPVSGRPELLLMFLSCGTVFALVYVVGIFALKCLDDYDMNLIRKQFSFLAVRAR
jgi:O-antigen/teichoic acid export membrane protein